MKYNKAKYLPFSLIESNQYNSLRWSILFKEADGTFTDQTGLFKCKDYFNDVVAKYHGVDVCVYGFDTVPMTLNEEGTYVLLSRLGYPDHLMKHLAFIAEKAEADGFPGLTYELQEKDIFLFIPRCFYEQTYTISMLTGLIRIAHSSGCFDSLEELVAKYPEQNGDRPFKNYTDVVCKESFKSPASDGWVYTGKGKPLPQSDSGQQKVIHDNGAVQVRNFLMMGI